MDGFMRLNSVVLPAQAPPTSVVSNVCQVVLGVVVSQSSISTTGKHVGVHCSIWKKKKSSLGYVHT